MDDKNANKIFTHLFQMEDRLNNKLESYHNEITEFKDGVHTRIDEVMGELIRIREEQSFSGHRISNLEERVETIEKVPVIAHTIKK